MTWFCKTALDKWQEHIRKRGWITMTRIEIDCNKENVQNAKFSSRERLSCSTLTFRNLISLWMSQYSDVSSGLTFKIKTKMAKSFHEITINNTTFAADSHMASKTSSPCWWAPGKTHFLTLSNKSNSNNLNWIFVGSETVCPEIKTVENLSKPRVQRQRERHQTQGLMSRTMAMHAPYNSWYISLSSSAKQQREITKFCVVWILWTTTANFLNFINFIALSQIQW